jgi:hypothetical protein
MSDHTFKTNFIDPPEESGSVQENYDFASNVRNVIFVLSNGNEVMRNYLYLVGVDLLKEGEKNVLELGFTSDTVLIEGYRLYLLRDKFIHQLPKIIAPNDPRYYPHDGKEAFVSSIVKKIDQSR